VVDFIKQIGRADTRPRDGSFQIVEHTCGGRSEASLEVPANSRIVYVQPLPRRGVLRVNAAVPGDDGPATVNFRIGISDDRWYETLLEQQVTSEESRTQGWTRLVVDLSRYAGPKISLFYQPDNRRWHVVFGTHTVAGSPAVAYWGTPGIDTDSEAARRFFKNLTVAAR
jgi:hypothetical protein